MKQVLGMLGFIMMVLTIAAFCVVFWGAVIYGLFWALLQVLSL